MKYIAITAIRERSHSPRLIVHYFDNYADVLKNIPGVKRWEWDDTTWRSEGQVRIFSKAARRFYSLRKFNDPIKSTNIYYNHDGTKKITFTPPESGEQTNDNI